MSTVVYVKRIADESFGKTPTLGLVTLTDSPFHCFSLEDVVRPDGVKVPGDTAIPRGHYPLRWRRVGRWAKRFQTLGFPGSLEVHDVPGFSTILLHIGNTKRDTEGCVLLGMGASFETHAISQSQLACVKLYRQLSVRGGEWYLNVQ